MTPTKTRCSCCRAALLLLLAETDTLICVACDALALWPDREAGR